MANKEQDNPVVVKVVLVSLFHVGIKLFLNICKWWYVFDNLTFLTCIIWGSLQKMTGCSTAPPRKHPTSGHWYSPFNGQKKKCPAICSDKTSPWMTWKKQQSCNPAVKMAQLDPKIIIWVHCDLLKSLGTPCNDSKTVMLETWSNFMDQPPSWDNCIHIVFLLTKAENRAQSYF